MARNQDLIRVRGSTIEKTQTRKSWCKAKKFGKLRREFADYFTTLNSSMEEILHEGRSSLVRDLLHSGHVVAVWSPTWPVGTVGAGININ